LCDYLFAIDTLQVPISDSNSKGSEIIKVHPSCSTLSEADAEQHGFVPSKNLDSIVNLSQQQVFYPLKRILFLYYYNYIAWIKNIFTFRPLLQAFSNIQLL